MFLHRSAEASPCTCFFQHQKCHLDLARSVRNYPEEQRALATIGRTYLFSYESDQSRSSLEKAEDAFRKSLSVVNDRLDGVCPKRRSTDFIWSIFVPNFLNVFDLQGRCLYESSVR